MNPPTSPPPREIRLALPSKGRLAEEALAMLDRAGLQVYKPNPRQYKAFIPALPGLSVLFQRPGDIVTSVRDGSVDFGITGWDVFCERRMAPDANGSLLALLEELRFGGCSLMVIVPETIEEVNSMLDLAGWQQQQGRTLRVATKFPLLTEAFFKRHGIAIQMISAEGTLEIAPTIGYADIIVDLVSTGTTLRDNRLKALEDGLVLRSQACLIANRPALKTNPQVLGMARQLLEFIIAYQRAAENFSVYANMRLQAGETPRSLAGRMFNQPTLGGLQGPTISPVITRSSQEWYAVHLIVRKEQLAQAIAELRQIGGSGVVVTPVTYIFEEEPQAYREMIEELGKIE